MPHRALQLAVSEQAALCTTGLALLGMTIADVPKGYEPDSVWSYELGAKTRLLNNRLQFNVAVFQIDWSNVQTAIAAQGCGQNWTVNGGTARSKGAAVPPYRCCC